MTQNPIINKLIQQLSSPDAEIRASAMVELVGQGNKAVPILTEKLGSSDVKAKELMMEALAVIGNPISLSLFLKSLKDGNPKVRAMAAQGLARLNHPEAINALIATIHDYGDETSPFTTSAYSLIDYGVEALPKVIPLLSSSSVYTREMGYRILAQIVTKIPEYRYKWNELNIQTGSYHPTAAEEIRESAIRKWMNWQRGFSKE